MGLAYACSLKPRPCFSHGFVSGTVGSVCGKRALSKNLNHGNWDGLAASDGT